MAKRRPPMSPLQRLATGFLGVVALLAIGVLLLSLARVRVTITPRAEPVTADFDLTIVGSGTPANRESLGRLVRVEGTGSAERVIGAASAPAPTSESAVAPARAEGTVTLVNAMVSPQPLVATTRLLSPNGVLFRLQRGSTVPAKGRIENIPVYADQAGAQGNIGPTKFTIPGLSKWLQERVWAESGAPMRGGRGTAGSGSAPALIIPPLAVVTAEHIEQVRAAVAEAAKADARSRAAAKARDGEEVFPLAESVSVAVEGAIGERRDRLRATGTVTMTALLVSSGIIQERAGDALAAVATASGRTLVRMRPDALRTRLVAQDPAAVRATIAVHAEGEASFRSGSFAFTPKRIAGFTAEEVRTYLRSLPGVQEVDVRLWPFWVNRVPSSVGRVEVQVEGAP